MYRISTEIGEKYINAQTKLPLYVSANDIWTYDDKQRIVEAKNQVKCMDRGWGQKDGDNVGWWQKHGGPNQKFTFELV